MTAHRPVVNEAFGHVGNILNKQGMTPQVLKQHLAVSHEEIALLDIREFGEYGTSHPFHAVNIPLSRLEARIGQLVPRRSILVVVMDAQDEGRARYSAQRLIALGYKNVRWLEGGELAWREAGYGVFAGVNVVSKTFGELVHKHYHTPTITAKTLADWQQQGKRVHVIDGRPIDEYRKMNIPGSICCPNGELVKRLPTILDGDTTTPVVINCAGRTRSIIGAQTLQWLSIENPIFALENGTQGWRLAGLDLEHGSDRYYPSLVPSDASNGTISRRFSELHGAQAVDAQTVRTWLEDDQRTTYIFDVRTLEEYRQASLEGALHAPGGQLIQATDHWVGVQHSRLVLIDDDECRAPVVAAWLALMGIEATWLRGGTTQWGALTSLARQVVRPAAPPTSDITTALYPETLILDARSGMQYRAGHLPGSRWVNRALLGCQLSDVDNSRPVVLIGDAEVVACLAPDLTDRGFQCLGWLDGDTGAWRRDGIELEVTPNDPDDASCIDYLFFVHDRHDGNLEASRRYLAWETGLLAQLDDQERATFAL